MHRPLYSPVPQRARTLATRRTASTSAASRPDLYSLFSCTSYRWLCNEELQLKLRYTPFDVDALEDIARRAASAQHCVSWKKIAEGSFNKVFLLSFDNATEIVVRIPCPVVSNVEQTVASEVATMCYIHERWGDPEVLTPHRMPFPPRVLAWNASYQNPAKIPYIMTEFAQGVPLAARWHLIEGDDAVEAVMSVLGLEVATLLEPFSQNGALFFVDDVSEELRQRPLYPPEYPQDLFERRPLVNALYAFADEHRTRLSGRYRVGASVEREWWRGAYAAITANRGPWPDMQSMLISAAEFQLRALDDTEILSSPFIRSRPSDVPLLRRLLHTCIRVAPFIVPRSEALTMPVLNHPDLSLRNLIVPPEGPAGVHCVIDWQGATISPYCMQCVLPEAPTYTMEVIQVPQDGSFPPWPDYFDDLPEEQKNFVRIHHRFACRHRAYVLSARKKDSLRGDAWDLPHIEPLARLVPLITRAIADGPRALRGCLMSLQEKWETFSDDPCPIGFDPEEVAAHRAEEQLASEYEDNVNRLYTEIGSVVPEPMVLAEDYERAKAVMEQRRAEWDDAAMKGPFPIYEGAPSYFLN
ncbi:hypothetical protein OH77DRAFT_1577287 [Trametes cingulata]|nr:hypothetical protein OH77DRAFT_1577287 [Trametes cingulata]